MKKFLSFVLFVIYGGVSVYAQEEVIKIATLSPAGSIFNDLLQDFSKEVASKTGVKFIIYPAGVMGDEETMIKKIRVGQLHGAAIIIIGIRKIAPEFSALDVPLLFKDYKEIDYIYEKFKREFGRLFEERGFKVLAFTEHGIAYYFSKKEISGFRDMGKTRIWAWKGERVAETLPRILGTSPIFLLVPDLLQGIETGMIESFQTTPASCLSLQWCRYVKVMIDFPYRFEPAVVVILKDVWDKFSPSTKKIIEETALKFQKIATDQIRKAQEEAKEKLKGLGIKFVKPPQEEIKWLEEEVKNKIWFAPNSDYPPEFLKRIVADLEAIRK